MNKKKFIEVELFVLSFEDEAVLTGSFTVTGTYGEENDWANW